MLTLLIVDDEKPIRQWFSFCVEKSGKPYTIVGEAANGKEAFEKAEQLAPDVVMTDITMPGMDGLELMRRLRTAMPHVDVVVLSCHADFHYAREAMKHGAFDYLLKAEAQHTDVIELLDKLAHKRKEQGLTQRAVELQHRLQREELLRDLLTGQLDTAALLTGRLRELGMELTTDGLFVMALEPVGYDQPGRTAVLTTYSVPAEHVERLYEFTLNGRCVLIGNLRATPSYLLQMQQLQAAARRLQQAAGVSVGVSSVYNGLECARKACEEALAAERQHFYHGCGLYFYATSAGGLNRGLAEAAVEPRQAKDKLRYEIHKAIQSKDGTTTLALLDSFLELIGRRSDVEEIPYLYRVCAELLESLYSKAATGLARTAGGASDYRAELRSKVTFTELRAWVLEQARRLAAAMSLAAKAAYNSSVQRALNYVEDHYCEEMALAVVAAHVHLNPNYFSQLFKETMGENFSLYIIGLRMRKAEELLKHSDLKMYEIAEKVGYPNVSYFSRKFKEYTGQSPFEYRRS